MLVKIDRKEALEMLVDGEQARLLYIKRNENYYRVGEFVIDFGREKKPIDVLARALGRGNGGRNLSDTIYFHEENLYKEINVKQVQKEAQQ